MSLTILLIGKGAREHALAWKLAASPTVAHVHVVPGNGGTARREGAAAGAAAKVSNLPAPAGAGAAAYPGYVDLARQTGAGLVVVGPDDEVVGGLEGYFREGE
jgi:phosphoribosylamine--glycine ligase/phosphoribosylformylglycinamidine cyclo-ligase